MRSSILRWTALILGLCLYLGLTPSHNTQAQSDQRCFPETGFCIVGRIRQYWEQNGGLAVFGYPITAQRQEPIEGTFLQVQWFERNRLELHPENAAPYDVLLGRLGFDRLAQQGRDWQQFPKVTAAPGDLCFFTPVTGHVTCSEFFLYFRTHGLNLDARAGYSEAESIALFGLPLSEPQLERNAADGKDYLTQWFERARFEYHPENQPPFNVLLGLLGNEIRGATPGPGPTPPPTAPPATTPTSTPTPGASAGRIAFVSDRDGDSNIYTMNPNGSQLTRLTDRAANYEGVNWSPDGQKLTFASDRDGNFEIYVMNANGSGITRLTDNGATDVSPVWSPDGRRIAFVTDRDDNDEIYSMRTDGSEIIRLTNNSAREADPAWSPDSRRIAFSSTRDLPADAEAESDIYLMNADGSGVRKLLEHQGGDWNPAWSPDGRQLAFSTHGFGQASGDVAGGDLFVINLDGTRLTQVAPDSVGGRQPSWSSDSKKLTFASARNDDSIFDIYVIGVDGSNLTKLTTNPSNDIDPSWSPR